jgi:hypothetical protein
MDEADPAEGASGFDAAAGDEPSEIGEVIAADTNPPVHGPGASEAIPILPDEGPPKDEEIDDLFVDLVEQV